MLVPHYREKKCACASALAYGFWLKDTCKCVLNTNGNRWERDTQRRGERRERLYSYSTSGEGKAAKSVALFKHSGHGDLHLTNIQSHMRTCTSICEHKPSSKTGSLRMEKKNKKNSNGSVETEMIWISGLLETQCLSLSKVHWQSAHFYVKAYDYDLKASIQTALNN